ncbi:MAG: hypothetical protein H7X83_03665 [Verrucomicrobia bacterium]|nr:hypothetical protein [Deltaproteobacteria bacterium]
MKQIQILVTAIVITVVHSSCYAGCNCDDWVARGGYCVDYVKTKIPTFPIPKTVAEIAALKNKETSKVTEGDVAIFDLGNYWHVAYIEKVHLDQQGTATAIDVSEMNFDRQISFDEYKNRWDTKNKSEWKRSLCCGVTKKYARISMRKNIALDSVEQVWSPVSAASQESSGGYGDTLMNKAREALNHIIQFTGREL